MAKIFRKRLDDKKLKTKVELSPNDQRRIAPTIAAVQPQPTKEIHKNKVKAHTRFRKTTEKKT